MSALPSPRARALAFATILLGGACGAMIGWGLVSVQCTGDCATAGGVGAVVGGSVSAVGVAVVAVLTLRAMGEWKTIKEKQRAEASLGEAE